MTRALLLAVSLTLTLGAGGAVAESQMTSITARAQHVNLAHVKAAFGRYLNAWSRPDQSQGEIAEVFTESALMEMKLTSHPELSVNISGREGIGRYLVDVGTLGRNWKFSDIYYFQTLQPGVFFVQYSATATSTATGQPLRYRNMVAVNMTGERIERITDFNGAPLAIAAQQVAHQLTVGSAENTLTGRE